MARSAAWGVIVALGLVAGLADCLAADRPLLLQRGGRTYVLPNLIDHAELAGLDGFALRQTMTLADWALWAPIRHDPAAVRSDGELRVLARPSAAHLLGTDDRGRDVAARLVHGTRTALVCAVGAAALALVVGVGLALLACGRGGAVDAAVVGACDLVGAVPALVVVIAVQGLLGRAGLGLVVVLIALPRCADTARVARAAMMAARIEPYCLAARALGAGRWRVLSRHALPQAMPGLAVATGLTAATAVLGEAALSFVGLGAPAATASWGELLRQAHENGLRWWLAIPPGVVIVLMAGGFARLADRAAGPVS
jgi:peptide/nickel transport system permease protein